MNFDPLKDVRLRKRVEQAQHDQVAGRYAAARTTYEDILATEENYPLAMHGFGVLCVQEGQYQQAERWLRQSVASAPEQASYWNDLGEVLRHLGRGEEAIECFHKALELQPFFVEVMNNLGVVLFSLGRASEAKLCFMEAIKCDSHFPNPYNNLGVLLENEGLFDAALQAYEAAVKLRHDFMEAVENYSQLLASQPERALDSMNRLLEVVNNNE